MQLRGTKVLVMGLGVHGGGLGVARWLLRQGAQVTVTDMAGAEALVASVAALEAAAAAAGSSVRYVLGTHRAEDFTGHAILVANPAVRPDSPWLALARAAGVPVETEMTLFFRRCPAPILGVTGTKGKTTTASLLAAMLRPRWPDTVLAGNLRVSALAALDGITATTPVVLELSSFQLAGLGEAGLSPQYAALTNISPDHLNYHGSMGAYIEAKRQIYAHQGPGGVVVMAESLVRDRERGGERAGRLSPPPSERYTFSLDPASGAECRLTAGGWVEFRGEPLFAAADLRLLGAHNLANAMAAAALARVFGAGPEEIRAAVRGFGGVEHRQELVRELDGVRYINDTTATNPAAALAALASVPGPIVLIAGGADKDLAFDALAAAIVAGARALVLLSGSATPKLQAAVERSQESGVRSQESGSGAGSMGIAGGTDDGGLAPVLGPYDDFAAAIGAARALAKPGDAVLLSPGCASFGMFRNEFHRGEEFRRIVGELED